MYNDRAEEEDKKMAESWKGDADGILVFVSAPLFFRASLVHSKAVDRSFLRCCCDTTFDRHPEPPAEPSGYYSVLSREHLSATCQSKWNPSRYPSVVV